jgi:hypothetical protein
LVKHYPRSAAVVARHLRASSNDEKELEDAVADALTLLGYTVRRLGGTGGTDGIALAKLGRRKDESATYALTYDAKSSAKDAQEVLTGDGAVPAKKSGAKAPRIQAGTARTSVLRVHREKAQARYSLPVAPEYTLLVAPGFQGDGVDDSLIVEICKNDGITPVTVEDLARLVELFPILRVSPAGLLGLYRSRAPHDTRKFVDDLSKTEKPPVPPVLDIINAIVEQSERKLPVTVDLIAGVLLTKFGDKVDLEEDEWSAIVRGLAALAPQSLYHDGRVIALNSSPKNLLAEIYESLGSYPDALVEDFRDAVSSTNDGSVT